MLLVLLVDDCDDVKEKGSSEDCLDNVCGESAFDVDAAAVAAATDDDAAPDQSMLVDWLDSFAPPGAGVAPPVGDWRHELLGLEGR